MSLTAVSTNTFMARYNENMPQEGEPHVPPQADDQSDRATRTDSPLDEQTRTRLIVFTREHYADPLLATYAALRFDRAGLLDVFEQSGLLPRVANPNPHDANLAPNEHEQWWAAHPEAAALEHELRIRDERLRLLYIGVLFGPRVRQAQDRLE
jgi:hypothetical protein